MTWEFGGYGGVTGEFGGYRRLTSEFGRYSEVAEEFGGQRGVTGEFEVTGGRCVLRRAQQIVTAQQSSDKENTPLKSGRPVGRQSGSFFKKKVARRAKSLGKDHWDDVIFGE